MIYAGVAYLLFGYFLGHVAHRNMDARIAFTKTLAVFSVLFWPVLLTIAIISMVQSGKRQ